MTVDCQLLAFKNHPVRALREAEWWFVGNDVCGALGLSKNPRMAVRRLDAAMKGVRDVYTLGGCQRLAVISERGVHSLALTSRSPAAVELTEWLARHVVAHLGGPAPLVLDAEFRRAARGLIKVPLTDLEFRLLEILHGRTRPAYSDWLAEVVGVSGGALHGLVHRLRRKLEALDYAIVNCRAGDGESGAYELSDLARVAKGRAA